MCGGPSVSSLRDLGKKVIRGSYAPISQSFSRDMRLLVKEMLNSEYAFRLPLLCCSTLAVLGHYRLLSLLSAHLLVLTRIPSAPQQ
jgi:hypothetical protein